MPAKLQGTLPTFPVYGETFEKCSILVKIKEGENFNHPREIGFTFHGAGRNILNISRIEI